jgi:hypothetical protein
MAVQNTVEQKTKGRRESDCILTLLNCSIRTEEHTPKKATPSDKNWTP